MGIARIVLVVEEEREGRRFEGQEGRRRNDKIIRSRDAASRLKPPPPTPPLKKGEGSSAFLHYEKNQSYPSPFVTSSEAEKMEKDRACLPVGRDEGFSRYKKKTGFPRPSCIQCIRILSRSGAACSVLLCFEAVETKNWTTALRLRAWFEWNLALCATLGAGCWEHLTLGHALLAALAAAVLTTLGRSESALLVKILLSTREGESVAAIAASKLLIISHIKKEKRK